MQIDLQTYAKRRGVSVDTVRRGIKNKDIQAVKVNGKYYIPEEGEQKGRPELSEAELKKIRLQFQIKQQEQTLKESIYKNFLMWGDVFKEAGIESASIYSAEISALKLTPETCEKINEAYKKCIIQTCSNTLTTLQGRLFGQV